MTEPQVVALVAMQEGGRDVDWLLYCITIISSLPCLHTFWHAIRGNLVVFQACNNTAN